MDETSLIKTCWVLDDTWHGYARRFWGEGLNRAGYDIQWVKKPSDFVRQMQAIKSHHPESLALLDIALDDPMPGVIQPYDLCVQDALSRRGTPMRFHGQAVGLWLWDQRHVLRLPYAYVSSHSGLFVSQLTFKQGDPEFAGKGHVVTDGGIALMLSRGYEGPIGDCVAGILSRWASEQWINQTGAAT
jgi:hypothetical protein